MKEAPGSSETSVLTRATRRNNPEDTILHSSCSFTADSKPMSGSRWGVKPHLGIIRKADFISILDHKRICVQDVGYACLCQYIGIMAKRTVCLDRFKWKTLSLHVSAQMAILKGFKC
jgi:hypothetical protein